MREWLKHKIPNMLTAVSLEENGFGNYFSEHRYEDAHTPEMRKIHDNLMAVMLAEGEG